jgi:small subunit ribosomal protein S1
MSDEIEEESSENEDESFAELFESYSNGMNEDLQVGDMVSGRVISIGRDAVFLDTGTKIDGAVDKSELLDENGDLPYSEGDTIELYVISMTESEVHLSKALSGIGGLQMLMDAYNNRIPVEGSVTEPCKGGFRVDILQRSAFCPISQMDLKYVDTPESYKGNSYQFLITQFDEKGRNIVVSRRRLLEKEQQEAMKTFYKEVSTGDVLNGIVTRVMPYGAFVELASGIEGMVHISELGWSRVEKTEDVIKPGDPVTVKVLSMKPAEKQGFMKISLSMKQVLDDPWTSVADNYQPGDKVTGRVTRCMKFGAFVEIGPGIEGLVHISEMSYVKRILDPADVVTEGETVTITIKEIDTQKRRVSLSIRDAEGDPWAEVLDKFQVGTLVEGKLEKTEKFGCFINLAPGITGLLPKSKMAESENPAQFDNLKHGQTLKVAVEEIHPNDRKITLAPADKQNSEDWKRFAAEPAAPSLGSLGEKLQQAMNIQKNKTS